MGNDLDPICTCGHCEGVERLDRTHNDQQWREIASAPKDGELRAFRAWLVDLAQSWHLLADAAGDEIRHHRNDARASQTEVILEEFDKQFPLPAPPKETT